MSAWASAPDPVLVRAAQEGNEEAFAALVDRYAGRLYHFLGALGLSAADADDLVQETLVRAYRFLDRYDFEHSFATWLFTIGRNEAVSHLRRQGRYRRAVEQLPERPESAAPQTDAADPDDGLWQRAAEVLSDEHLLVLWLRYGEDFSMQEISAATGLSEENARVIIHRSRQKLAAAWAETPEAAGRVRT